MKKKILTGIIFSLLLFGMAGISSASLEKIGVAEYNNSYYAMIYDDDRQLIWMDYSNTIQRVNGNLVGMGHPWEDQVAWAASLNEQGVLRYAYYPEYSNFTWTGDWRLPDAHNQDGTGPFVDLSFFGPDFEVVDLTGSEMGHLFITELGNTPTRQATNTGEFQNLITNSFYYSGTPYDNVPIEISPGVFVDGIFDVSAAWAFGTYIIAAGPQDITTAGLALAVRSGHINAVPVPGAFWLLGSGLLGLVGFRRKLKK